VAKNWEIFVGKMWNKVGMRWQNKWERNGERIREIEELDKEEGNVMGSSVWKEVEEHNFRVRFFEC
jgi:hypothetical protein